MVPTKWQGGGGLPRSSIRGIVSCCSCITAFLFICVHGDGRIAKQGNGERGLSGAMDDSIPIAPTTQDPWRQCGAVIIFCLSLTETFSSLLLCVCLTGIKKSSLDDFHVTIIRLSLSYYLLFLLTVKISPAKTISAGIRIRFHLLPHRSSLETRTDYLVA